MRSDLSQKMEVFLESETQCQSEDKTAHGNYHGKSLVSMLSYKVEGFANVVAHSKTSRKMMLTFSASIGLNIIVSVI